VIEHQICCNANVDFWDEVSDRILIAGGRFWGEADMHGRVTETASVVDDPDMSLTW
jgi:hypothetical protein